jgi:hypothetical protein
LEKLEGFKGLRRLWISPHLLAMLPIEKRTHQAFHGRL